jgi:hypothetical protein
MYTEAAAARLLQVAPSTLHWWLEGRPPRYRPAIRGRSITSAERSRWIAVVRRADHRFSRAATCGLRLAMFSCWAGSAADPAP